MSRRRARRPARCAARPSSASSTRPPSTSRAKGFYNTDYGTKKRAREQRARRRAAESQKSGDGSAKRRQTSRRPHVVRAVRRRQEAGERREEPRGVAPRSRRWLTAASAAAAVPGSARARPADDARFSRPGDRRAAHSRRTSSRRVRRRARARGPRVPRRAGRRHDAYRTCVQTPRLAAACAPASRSRPAPRASRPSRRCASRAAATSSRWSVGGEVVARWRFTRRRAPTAEPRALSRRGSCAPRPACRRRRRRGRSRRRAASRSPTVFSTSTGGEPPSPAAREEAEQRRAAHVGAHRLRRVPGDPRQAHERRRARAAGPSSRRGSSAGARAREVVLGRVAVVLARARERERLSAVEVVLAGAQVQRDAAVARAAVDLRADAAGLRRRSRPARRSASGSSRSRPRSGG